MPTEPFLVPMHAKPFILPGMPPGAVIGVYCEYRKSPNLNYVFKLTYRGKEYASSFAGDADALIYESRSRRALEDVCRWAGITPNWDFMA